MKNAQEPTTEYEQTRHALAAYAHEAWSGWMKHLFGKSATLEDGACRIPAQLVERWQRQMNTVYEDLPEGEKESDLAEAYKMLEIVISKEHR